MVGLIQGPGRVNLGGDALTFPARETTQRSGVRLDGHDEAIKWPVSTGSGKRRKREHKRKSTAQSVCRIWDVSQGSGPNVDHETLADATGLAELIPDVCRLLVRSTDAAVGYKARPQQILNLLGAGGRPMTTTMLAHVAGVTHQSMSAIIGRLEEQGLVVRKVDPKDRRRKNVLITPKGGLKAQSAKRDRAPWLAKGMLYELTQEQRDHIRDAMTDLNQLVSSPYLPTLRP